MNSLEKHVLDIIGDDTSSPDVFSDITPIRDSITDAIQEISMLTGGYKKTYHLITKADNVFYRISTTGDYIGYVYSAFNRNNKWKMDQTDVQTITREDPWYLQQNGNIRAYFQIGSDVIGIWQRPDTDGVVIELDCVMIPKAYTTDNDPIKLRENFQTAAVYYAVNEYYAGRGNADRALEYYDRYLEALGMMNIHPQQAEKSYQMARERQLYGNI